MSQYLDDPMMYKILFIFLKLYHFLQDSNFRSKLCKGTLLTSQQLSLEFLFIRDLDSLFPLLEPKKCLISNPHMLFLGLCIQSKLDFTESSPSNLFYQDILIDLLLSTIIN